MPSKTIEDFAYQVRDYMRSAEVVEGKNLLPLTLEEIKAIPQNGGTWNNNVYTVNNATFTVISGDSGYIEKITISSSNLSSDATLWLNFRGYTSDNNLAGDIISNIYTGNSNGDVFQVYRIGNKTSGAYIDRLTDGTDAITIPTLTSEQDGSIGVVVKAGVTVSNIEYYPMICSQEEWEKSHTYEPYYVPVKDRDAVIDVTSKFEYASGVTGSSLTKIYKCGNMVFGSLVFTTPSSSSTDPEIMSCSADLVPAGNQYVIGLCYKTWDGAVSGLMAYQNNRKFTLTGDEWATNRQVTCPFAYPIKTS